MNMKKTLLMASLFLALTVSALNAQDYRTAAGVRLGYDSGITLKHFISPVSALEGIMSVSPNYFHLTGLYEYHQPVPDMANLNWYLGLGGHLGSLYKKGDRSGDFLLGADAIAGLEYIFPSVPFSVSLDWKPSFNFTTDYNEGWFYSFGLSLRYTFR